MRKICVVTGTRAEYGLLYWVLKELQSDSNIKLQLVVTGMHLSPEFGLTYKEIQKDFKIDKKVEMLLSSDTPIGISKAMGLAQICFAEVFDELKPDILLILGDRYEILSVASAAMIARIPIAHIHGGETTEGIIDEAIRHSLTKMSHIHFATTAQYRKRIIQLGEHPSRVFNVGGVGIENINRLKLLDKDEFEKSINFKLNKKNILATYHPNTLENNTSSTQFNEILQALDELKETNIIFTKSNSDTYGRIINQMIDEYVASHKNSVAFTSLGQLRYLSALKHVDIVLGNSSSGIAEAPSFKISTINIGDRQKGRIMADSIINCDPNKEQILQAIYKVYSDDFQRLLKDVKNPYDNGNTSKKIVEILKNISLDNILKKEFYNLDFKCE
ncbi:UDP-N-acetylglucosamine 2-epimerase [Campylobacter mucosalis]|uniref:UDP-N-acetylglucosamine 2-epimerase n=1 Tax=Campylobacter mucosalis TaxID=202 RepID=UPI0004D83A10|nr:UDP-N-acetylglucosamine 2-epimerase [Campylobacter mucosalis]KEA45837.1 UDP-N-acetylglucosamine 2-epimerase [Campylobacter mucosalis]QKF62365.1 GDP-2,4-diacetamido-2,4,6-trideoxy-alpha-D-glucopyranose hydrolase / 2-epimerase [Campylobacter mucosalis]